MWFCTDVLVANTSCAHDAAPFTHQPRSPILTSPTATRTTTTAASRHQRLGSISESARKGSISQQPTQGAEIIALKHGELGLGVMSPGTKEGLQMAMFGVVDCEMVEAQRAREAGEGYSGECDCCYAICRGCANEEIGGGAKLT